MFLFIFENCKSLQQGIILKEKKKNNLGITEGGVEAPVAMPWESYKMPG